MAHSNSITAGVGKTSPAYSELARELNRLEWLACACRHALAAHLAWQRGLGVRRLSQRSDSPGDARLLGTVGLGLYQLGGLA